MEKAAKTRARQIDSIKKRLLSESFPRLQISFILLVTALTGFLFSFAMLNAGVSSMTLRYPIAIALAYCVFLLLLRVWLWLQNNSADADLPSPDFGGSSGSSAGGGSNFNFGGGGDFSGAGAGGDWSAGDSSSSSLSGGDSLLDGANFDFDLEEIGLIIVVVVAVLGGLLASFYIIYAAPALLAEIFVDGVLIAGLYKRVRGIERQYWLATAIKRTIVPVILATVFFTVAGFAVQKAVPEADSIGQVWEYLSAQ